MLVRTWNLFHGNVSPPEPRAFLEEMVARATADRPDILLLQELPVWALRRLGAWTAMAGVGAVAARPKLPSRLGRLVTELNTGIFRSALTGQGNALLVGPSLRLVEHRVLVLNPLAFRRQSARRLRLGIGVQLAWAKERRVCQIVRVRREDGSTLVAANMHATSHRTDKRIADAELFRAATFVDGFARPEEPVLLGGDLNASLRKSRFLPELLGDEWRFEGATPHGIDHLLSRGLALGPAMHWPDARRRLDGRLLSDHAPVERRDA